MSFTQEVKEFKKTNGNRDYTSRDMLMFLCNKSEKHSLDISDIKTELGIGKEKFKWLKGTDAVYFTFFCALLYFIFSLHGIL